MSTATGSTESPVDVERAIDRATGTERAVWAALRSVEDPELPISVVDLGLVYGLRIDGGHVDIDVTLTYSGCPARDLILADMEREVLAVDGVTSVDTSLQFSPPWTYDRITDAGREALADHGIAIPETRPSDNACEETR